MAPWLVRLYVSVFSLQRQLFLSGEEKQVRVQSIYIHYVADEKKRRKERKKKKRKKKIAIREREYVCARLA